MEAGMTKKKPTAISDSQILQAMRRQGASGWELFCSQFDPLIRTITAWPKWSFSEEEQLDVRQDIYVQLQTALPAFRKDCTLKWFIKKIAMRQCINEIRRQVRWRTVMTPAVEKNQNGEWFDVEYQNGNAPDPLGETSKHEQLQALAAALGTLKNTCKNSITLFYVRNCSYREMAVQLGVSVNTVGSRLSKCLSKLQRELQQNPRFERPQS